MNLSTILMIIKIIVALQELNKGDEGKFGDALMGLGIDRADKDKILNAAQDIDLAFVGKLLRGIGKGVEELSKETKI